MPSMHIKNSRWHVAALVLLCLIGGTAGHAMATAPSGGVSLAPATLTLSLAPGERLQTGTFMVTNHYQSAITLHFALEKSPSNVKSALDVTSQLSIAAADMNLAAGQTTIQTLTLHDAAQLPPGSQLANLIVTERAASGAQIGVGASLTMPLITIKEAGAVSSVGAGSLHMPHFAWQLPASISASVRNTGNTIVIPHGLVSVRAPNGQLVKSGVVNIPSAATSPGSALALNTPLVSVHRALWPGMYRATFSFGLGGGQPTKTMTIRFLYLAWWHVILISAATFGLYRAVRSTIHSMRIGAPGHGKKPVLSEGKTA